MRRSMHFDPRRQQWRPVSTRRAFPRGGGAMNWFGPFARAKTPEPVLKKLNDAVTQALKSPELAKKLEVQGMEPRAEHTAAVR
jgi:Tripartite tricarboxylate transporter family receptor